MLEGIEGLVEASDASWLLIFHSFVCSAYESLKSSHFRSRLPFLGFHPRVSFFFYSFSFFDCPIMHLKIHPEQVNGLSRILAEEKRQQEIGRASCRERVCT